MSNIPISSLPVVTAGLDGTEMVPLVQGGTTKRTTTGAIAAFGVAGTSSGATFVTATAQGSVLPGSRQLAATSPVTLTDNGVGSTLVIGLNTIGGSGTVTSVALSGGTTGLTVSGSPIITNGTMTLGGFLSGSSIATNSIAFAQVQQAAGLSVIGVAAVGTANLAAITGLTDQVLRVNNVGNVLGFGALNLAATATSVTGVLPVANGGSGASTLAANSLLLGNTGSPITNVTNATAGYVLTSTGAGSAPTFQATGTGSGSVTSVAAGNGLATNTGAAITNNGTLSVQQITPGGRLTLISAQPVMRADSTSTTVWYAPFNSPFVPVYDGTNMKLYNYTSSSTDAVGTSLAMAGNSAWANTALYDLALAISGGTLFFGTLAAWTNTTTRADAVSVFNGLMTNTNTATLRYAPAATATIPPRQATVLGTMYMTGTGTTAMIFKPSPALGGTSNVLGLDNGYNKIPTQALVRDSTPSWSTTNRAFETMNTSTGWRASMVDSFGINKVVTSIYIIGLNSVAANNVQAGIMLDATNGTAGQIAAGISAVGNANIAATALEIFPPAVGFHFFQALQTVSNFTGTFTGSPYSSLVLQTEM
jgi:hypothetical protein